MTVRAMKAGAAEFLRKLFEPGELLECLREALTTSQARGAIPRS
jgi:FixJ family two-component response regulator